MSSCVYEQTMFETFVVFDDYHQFARMQSQATSEVSSVLHHTVDCFQCVHYVWCLRCYCVKLFFFCHLMRFGKLMLSSLLLRHNWQSGTGDTHVNHQTLYCSSSIIPTRVYRRYSAVNTLYIFMFWEVLLDFSVSIEWLVQETLFVSGGHII